MSYLRRLVVDFPPWRSGFEPRSDHLGFVVDKVTLRQVFSEYFRFPCQLLFQRLLHTLHHHHHHHHQLLGAGITNSVELSTTREAASCAATR
jgi:hypothetical protein